MEECKECPLNGKSSFVPPSGRPLKLVIVGEAPWVDEVRLGKPFVGKTGQVVRRLLKANGIDEEACYFTNAVKCSTLRPPKAAIRTCARILERELAKIPTSIPVALFGNTALAAFGWDKIANIHGTCEVVNGRRFVRMYHPASGFRRPTLRRVIEEDFKRLREVLEQRSANIEVVEDDESIVAIDTEVVNGKVVVIGVCEDGKEKGRWYRTEDWKEHYIANVINHNAKFDALELRKVNISEDVVADTMLMAQLTSNWPVGLKTLGATKLAIPMNEFASLAKKYGGEENIPLDVLGEYCAEDARVTRLLYETLKREMYDKAWWLMREVELPLIPVIWGMEARGVCVDVTFLEELGRRVEAALKTLTGKYDFNLASTKQLREALKNAGVTVAKTTATGVTSTDEKALAPYRSIPLVADVFEFRRLAKLHGTYVMGLLNAVEDDGRVRTHYNNVGAQTGRWSSSDPINLQNLVSTKGNKVGSDLRKAIIAGEGKVLLKADVSQAELKVAAWRSGDPAMLDIYQNGKDIHDETERAIFGTSHVHRTEAKTTNFSTLYLIGSKSLAENLTVDGVPTTPEQAERFIRGFWKKYSGLRDYVFVREWNRCKEEPVVVNEFGRRYVIDELRYPDTFESGMKKAINYPIQGTVADYIKLVMLEAVKEFGDPPFILQVHDELVLELSPGDVDEYARFFYHVHERIPTPLPLTFEVKTGYNWFDMKGVERR